ncbi:MAG: hypothetical protein Q4C73_00785 [Eubacteriales bacterium]|nr:hypothetical protein [Eubacteriales bacterium]
MTLKNRLLRDLKKDLETLKTLNFRQKLQFILDYYRGRLFVLLVLCMIGFYVGDTICQSRQIIDLQGFFVNDRQDLFPAGELTEDFSDYMDTPLGHRIAFEDSLYVTLDSSNEYNAASQGKIVAYTAAKQLDFFVAPEELAKFYADTFLLYDLEELLPEELQNDLKEDFYYAADGTGQEKACGLNLRRSRFLQNPLYDGAEDYYLLVLSYTSRTDAMISFIKYAYDR